MLDLKSSAQKYHWHLVAGCPKKMPRNGALNCSEPTDSSLCGRNGFKLHWSISICGREMGFSRPGWHLHKAWKRSIWFYWGSDFNLQDLIDLGYNNLWKRSGGSHPKKLQVARNHVSDILPRLDCWPVRHHFQFCFCELRSQDRCSWNAIGWPQKRDGRGKWPDHLAD